MSYDIILAKNVVCGYLDFQILILIIIIIINDDNNNNNNAMDCYLLFQV